MQRAQRQGMPGAMEWMAGWANAKFGLGWTPEKMRTTPPQELRKQLLEASERYVKEGKLEADIAEALACTTREEIIQHFKTKYNATVPDRVTRLKGEDRDDAVRARVESIRRVELLMFERSMLLEVLDPTWKDHLYAMDQLKDTINYRAFSQQDPRIEYKREGSKLFADMMEGVRDKVTDFVFKMKLNPQASAVPRTNPGLYIPPSGGARPAGPRPAAPVGGAPVGGVSGARSTSDLMYPPPPPPPPSSASPRPPAGGGGEVV